MVGVQCMAASAIYKCLLNHRAYRISYGVNFSQNEVNAVFKSVTIVTVTVFG